MTSEEDRKLALLETLVNNQKHMIELLSILNNNVEELILDIKDIKNTPKYDSPLPSSSCSSDSLPKKSQSHNNAQSHHTLADIITAGANNSACHNNNHFGSTVSSNHQLDQIQQQQSQHSFKSMESIEIDTSAMPGSRQQHTFIESNNNRLENLSPNNESYKSVKIGLREFSTFVSKMVRQEFGCNFLALTRINELDRYTMQRIRDEAVAKYLPTGISPQFAWNHAMNSLRQLRHRQCKKAKITL